MLHLRRRRGRNIFKNVTLWGKRVTSRVPCVKSSWVYRSLFKKKWALNSSHACPTSQVSGDPAVSPQLEKFMGIRNGIDIDIWDPATDSALPVHYGPSDMVEGKARCREALRQRLGLTGWGDRPMIGVVTRLTAQKGALGAGVSL